ncbi:hypothetical protein GCK72_013665 [Caenorhabditis remanei]|uniref:Uncharacterized protein n=1 Tax=Caenorhabditis remanei TaxID=31234 RepID=A0A6A5GPC0_CAERE|nr:hypothetical protein GCK72_013665 [Caenorhabditis remanei]KAF1757210.1 hypothetical protein GCK72_013665 [Caenorhabditis remanei]
MKFTANKRSNDAERVSLINSSPIEIDGNIAYVKNVRAKLLLNNGSLVFRTEEFGNVFCPTYLPTGDYRIKIHSLITPKTLSSGEEVHFEATDKVLISNTPSTQTTFAPIAPALAQVSAQRVGPKSPVTAASPTPSGGSSVGSRASTPAGNNDIVKGAGFPKQNPKWKQNKKTVVGNGFPVKKEDNKVVVGEGFAVPKQEEKVVVGAGFEVKPQKTMKLRAVVLSINENKNGSNTHYLWILDRHAEGRFVSKDYKLLQGHFFEGIFKENTANRWNCEKYERQIEKLSGIDGGIDYEQKIWFTVTINNFQPAGGNRRFGNASAKYFGEIIEGEPESAKLSASCNGTRVKIQRKGVGEKDYVWMVVEKL